MAPVGEAAGGSGGQRLVDLPGGCWFIWKNSNGKKFGSSDSCLLFWVLENFSLGVGRVLMLKRESPFSFLKPDGCVSNSVASEKSHAFPTCHLCCPAHRFSPRFPVSRSRKVGDGPGTRESNESTESGDGWLWTFNDLYVLKARSMVIRILRICVVRCLRESLFDFQSVRDWTEGFC